MELGLSVGMAGSVESELSSGSKDSVVREPEDDHPSLNLELRPAWLGDLEPGNGFSSGQINPHGCRGFETDPSPAVPLSIKTERLQWRSCDEDDGSGQGARKKLRLTKEQSCYLEQSFKEQATLNPKQKLAIARKLGLQPRQVEVWFQNRRARTKLKQTETDFEHLKRLCETLTVENQKLHRELEELKAFSSPLQQLYPLSPAAMLALCPSCERASVSGEAGKKLGGHRNRPKHRESFHHNLAYQVGQIH